MAKRIALFGGSFNPPGLHHRHIAKLLSERFDEVIIIPCGPRPDKPVTNDVPPIYRASMVDMTFQDMDRVRVDLFDLEADDFTRNYQLQAMYESQGEVWHVIGADLIHGGSAENSLIHRTWEQGSHIWHEYKFAVFARPGYQIGDLPPHHEIFETKFIASSADIRNKVFHHQDISQFVTPKVVDYIRRHRLYRSVAPQRNSNFMLESFRPHIIADPYNDQAQKLAKQLGQSYEQDANIIVVIGGDGTMLRAIRSEWRRRLPFYGVNAGHLGFLLNNELPVKPKISSLVGEHLPLLRVQATDEHGARKPALAFNDAWVERASGQAAWLQVKVDGKTRLPLLVADGALISTAAGSSSYARAMGAPPLPISAQSLLLVGSNVLKPNYWRPVVLSCDAQVELTTHDPHKRPLRGFIDGIPQGEVVGIEARVSKIAAVELAFDPGHDTTEKLAQIQFPPPEEWENHE